MAYGLRTGPVVIEHVLRPSNMFYGHTHVHGDRTSSTVIKYVLWLWYTFPGHNTSSLAIEVLPWLSTSYMAVEHVLLQYILFNDQDSVITFHVRRDTGREIQRAEPLAKNRLGPLTFERSEL